MRIEAYELNKVTGIDISKTKLKKSLKYYRGMYCNACEKLYDLYFLSEIELDMIELVRAMNEEFPEYMHLFRNEVDAIMDWTSNRCRYILDIAKGYNFSDKFISVVKILETLFKSSEAISALTNIENRCKFTRGTSVKNLLPKINISNRVYDSSLYNFDNFAVQELFYTMSSERLIYVNTNDILRLAVLREIGVSDLDIEVIKSRNESYFVKGLTYDEELIYLDLILSGAVDINGTYADLLKEKLDENAQYSIASTKTRGMTVVSTFADQMFIKSLSDRCEYVKLRREELQSRYAYVRPYYVLNSGVYFAVSDEEYKYSGTSFDAPRVFTGMYAYDYVKNEFLSEINLLEGISGEYISEADAIAQGYTVTASPIKVKTNIYKSGDSVKMSIDNYYPISECRLSEDKDFSGKYISRPLVAKYDEAFMLLRKTPQDIWGTESETNKQDFYNNIRSKVNTVFKITDNLECYLDYVAELVCALKYLTNGAGSYSTVYDCYSYITEDLYNKACYDAILLYRVI